LSGVKDRLKSDELCCLFEVGSVFLPRDDSDLTQLADERLTLGIVMAGQTVEPSMHEPQPRPVDFFDLKGVCEALLQSTPACAFEKCEGAPFQPGQTAQVLVNGSAIGRLGKVHPSVCAAFDIEGVDVYAAEWNLDALLDASSDTFTVREPSRYPSIEIDISFILDAEIEAAGIAQTARTAGGAFVDDVTLVGVYAGSPIPEGQKSVTIRIVLNAHDRSMRTEEAMEIREAIVERVREEFGAEVRE
jgi:phenylalanyl-tRNA synthetase beta chain